MYSKHSALESRILRINRNNDVIFLLETKWHIVGSSVERRKDIFRNREDTLLSITNKGKKGCSR